MPGPKKGVWNFQALRTPALLRLESSRHLFLGGDLRPLVSRSQRVYLTLEVFYRPVAVYFAYLL